MREGGGLRKARGWGGRRIGREFIKTATAMCWGPGPVDISKIDGGEGEWRKRGKKGERVGGCWGLLSVCRTAGCLLEFSIVYLKISLYPV